MMDSRYPQLHRKLRRAVLELPACLHATLRRAAYDGTDATEPLRELVETLRRHAYRLQDSDIERVRRAGYSDDQIFEITIAAALGAGDRRLHAGLSALNEALR